MVSVVNDQDFLPRAFGFNLCQHRLAATVTGDELDSWVRAYELRVVDIHRKHATMVHELANAGKE